MRAVDLPARRQRHKAGSPNAQGVLYERKVGKALSRSFPSVLLGQWLEFEDDHGRGRAQPDIILLGPWPVVVEVKRTYCLDAAQQLEWTYAPLVSALFKAEVVGMVVVCQNWVGPPVPPMLDSLRDLGKVPPGQLAHLHLPLL